MARERSMWMNTKSSRNKTIDFDISEGSKYLDACLTEADVEKHIELKDVTILGDNIRIAKLLPNKSIDLLILDPPYNLTKTFSKSKFKKKTAREYEAYTRQWLEAFMPLLKDNASIYVCCDWETSLIIGQVLPDYLIVRNRITWQREKGRGAKSNWKNAMEDIWFATKTDDYTFNLDAVKVRKKVIAPYRQDGAPKDWDETSSGNFRDTCPSNFWDDITIPFWSMPENTAHPTQKSEKLIAKLILASSNPGDLVLDPFLGSGTTSVVAKKLQRHYIGIECEPQYCAWAEYRLSQTQINPTIQGYTDGVFWERNTLPQQSNLRSSDSDNKLF